MTDKVWHVELVVDDKDKAAQWYADVFGWQVENFEDMGYIQVRSGPADPTVAFMPPQPDQGMPLGTALVYIDVADLDAVLARAAEQGGSVLMENMTIPNVGTMNMIADPHGNRVALMQPTSNMPSTNNPKVKMLAEQIRRAIRAFTGTMRDLNDEIAHHQPGGKANSIAANAAHVVTAVDGVVNSMLRGEAPVAMSMETGLSEFPPRDENIFNWHDWGTRVRVDIEKFEPYASRVFDSIDKYLGKLTDSDLDTVHQTPAGERTTFDMLNGAVLNNFTMHTGEISALKGQQGLKGYEF